MAVHPFQHEAGAVEVEPVFRVKFDGAEAYALLLALHHLPFGILQVKLCHIEVRAFGVPGLGAAPRGGELLLHGCALEGALRLFAALRGEQRLAGEQVAHRNGHGIARRRILHFSNCFKLARMAGADHQVAHMGGGDNFQPYRAVDAAKQPPVCLPFRRIDGTVGRVLRHFDFQRIVPAPFQEVGDVV